MIVSIAEIDSALSKYHHPFGFVKPSLSANGVLVSIPSFMILIYIGVFLMQMSLISCIVNIVAPFVRPHAVITIATTAQKGGIL